MVKYIIKRVLYSALILLIVSMLLYLLVRCLPIDYVENHFFAQANAGQISREEFDRIKALYGLEDSSFLGICRGIQAVNVFLGGTLRQHIDGHGQSCHKVRCAPRLAALVGAAPTVNSYHHQAVGAVAPSLHAAAWAEDGTVEALLHDSAPILGVQWHPERMVPPLCEDVAGANHLAVFRWLCERC